MNRTNKLELETKLTHIGTSPINQRGFVTPPLYKGSTVLYQNVEDMRRSAKDFLKIQPPFYGRFGTPTSRSFEQAMSELEGGYAAITTSSGLAAITTTIQSLVKQGDHILIADSAYLPTRRYCESLKRFGINVEFYSASPSTNIKELIQSNTVLVYIETPGSLTFDIQDIPAITKICREQNIISVVDNTWATPLFCRPMALGADIVIHSATKYITGHSDSILGVIICSEKTYPLIRSGSIILGQCAGSEDIAMGLRGLRTLSVRLQLHQRQGLEIATWLQQRKEVHRVLHPALKSHPGNDIWNRDFSGSTGLFSVELRDKYTTYDVDVFLNSLKLFGLGHSWGGFESLIVPIEDDKRSNERFKGRLLRIHIGLENIDDLRQDLEQGFSKLSY